MNHRSFSLLIGLLTSIAAAVYFRYFPQKNKPDYKSGVFSVRVENNPDVATVNRSFSLIKDRLTAAGLRFTLQPRGNDEAEIRIREIRDSQFIAPLLTSPGRLEIRASFLNSELSGLMQKAITVRKAALEKDAMTTAPEKDTMNGDVKQLVEQLDKNEYLTVSEKEHDDPLLHFLAQSRPEQSVLGWIKSKDTQALNTLLNMPEIKREVLPAPVFLYGASGWKLQQHDPDNAIAVYAVKNADGLNSIVLNNDDLRTATRDYSYEGEAVIKITFNKNGTRKWEQLTAENVEKPLAMMMDGSVFSAPLVVDRLTGSNAQIYGDFTEAGALMISAILKNPPLPKPVRITAGKLEETKTWFSVWQWVVVALAGLITGGLCYLLLLNFNK